MTFRNKGSITSTDFLMVCAITAMFFLTLLTFSLSVSAFGGSYSDAWKLLQDLVEGNDYTKYYDSSSKRWNWNPRPSNPRPDKIQTKVVFPIPEDVIENRSYLPNIGFLTDLAFLLLPEFPATGIVRLGRDLFESEQCVQYVSCEMTNMAQRHRSLTWLQRFLQDFPFQGDVADRLREGSVDAIKKRAEVKQDDDTVQICSHSCNPIKSLSRGLKILSLLHDLVRTVKF